MGKNKKKESKEQQNGNDQDIKEQAQTEDTALENEKATDTTEKEETVNPTEKKIAELEEQLAEMKDKYLRQIAEFDNYRKRTLKEKAELILNGGEKVMTSLLPVMDDFERAESNFEKSQDVEALKEGVDLIFQKFQKVMESQGLKKIETEGKDFDTDFHEAIAMIPAQKDEDKGKVMDCVQTGYTLNDKVIRHAKVAIGQ